MLETFRPIFWTAVPLIIAYCIQTLRRWRYLRFRKYADIPQLAKLSFVWGHMKAIVDLGNKIGDTRRHLDDLVRSVRPGLGNPPVVLVDLRPLDYPMLFICDHEVAEQITRPSARWWLSIPKSETLKNIWHLTGHQSILTLEGERWRDQRRRLNPGFAPQQILTFLPVILEKTQIFLDRLDHYVHTGEEFPLDELCMTLTFDIIGAVTMGQELNAQIPEQQSEVVAAFRGISEQFTNHRSAGIPGQNWKRERIRRRLAKKLDGMMKDIVRAEYAKVASGKTNSRSVLALSLQGTEELTPELLQQTSDNLRVFLFAGHDTTGILMQWAFYELSKSPRQRESLCAELDELFGADADPKNVRDTLLAPGGTEILSRMPYTSAVIKEILRLHPPGTTVRMTAPGTNFQLSLPGGKQICVDDCVLYNCAAIIHRDKRLYGETADDFIPERWLGDTSTLPAGAWRPFERGPRSCIGQELANIEAKIILACAARRYDFQKVGLGELELDGAGKPVLDEKGYYRTKSELFNTVQVTAKPVDRSVMKVKLSEQANRK